MAAHQGLGLESIIRMLDGPATAARLGHYYAEFTGRHFDSFAGGGDAASVRDRITAEDLIAVQMLSVSVPAAQCVDLLEGELGSALTAQLAQIPTGIDLGTGAADRHLADGMPAERAWRLLNTREPNGIGWVIAGKVLARKRPRLIPVYDRVVRCALGRPRDYWQWLDGRFRQDDGRLREHLQTIRDKADIPAAVSILRVFDVAVWTLYRQSHSDVRCLGAVHP
jgi:hypothetical protein